MKILFFALMVFGVSANAGLFDIQNRPLRVLNMGTELLVTIEGDLQAGRYYQNGKAVLTWDPNFDRSKPYCEVDSFSKVPDFEDRSKPLKLIDLEGSISDDGTAGEPVQFFTRMQFSGFASRLDISCYSESAGSFKEITLGEFETVFGPHLRFGSLSLGDPGIELQRPLYPEYYVLDAKTLRSIIKLETSQPISLSFDRDTNSYRATIAGGKVITENDYAQPYCHILHVNSKVGPKTAELVIPANLTLRFSGNVSGSYKKMNGWDSGFAFYANVIGYEMPLQFYCSSLDSNQPLRYAGASLATKSIISWIFSF